MCKPLKFIGKAIGTAAAVYAGLFVIFYFDLDGKLLYKYVEPALCNHYDNMERRDPMSVPYDMIDKETM